MSEVRARGIDAEPEQEVDLRTLWARLVSRWWLPLAGLVLGAVVGVLAAVGGGQTWKAKTLLYLGQPFTTSGGGQIQSLATNPRTASEIVRSELALRRAAAASGLRLGQLRGHVATQAVASAGQAKIVSPLVEISVDGHARVKVEKATDALARAVISRVSVYVDRKIALLDEQIASSQGELKEIDARVADSQARLQSIVSSSLSATEKLIATLSLNSTINFFEQRRSNVQEELFQNQQLLSLALNVEKSNIVQPAAAVRVTATSRRNSAAIGGLIGLILGGVAAYLAEPVLARRNTLRAA